MRTAFYDLSVSPATWEFTNSLLLSKKMRCTRMVIVPGRRSPSITHYSDAVVERRIETMMVPLIESLGMECVVARSREDAQHYWSKDCFPDLYRIDSPVSCHRTALIAEMSPVGVDWGVEPQLLERIRAKYEGCVTITIREQTFQHNRDSNIPEWIKAAQELKRRGLRPVFVPDFEKLDTDFQCETSVEAATDMATRIALYKVAMTNFFITNGPLSLALFTSLPFIVLKLIIPEYSNTTERVWKKSGIEVGSQPKWLGKHQLFVWKDDDEGEILKAMERWRALNPERVLQHA